MLRTIRFFTILALLAALAAGGNVAAAQRGGTVVATGLADPRGITIGPDGSVYVAEAGTGGDQTATIEGETFHFGNTGQVTRIAPNGSKKVVARGFFSGASPEGEIAGVHALLYAGGALWATTSGVLQAPVPIPGTGALVKIDPATGNITPVADLQGYEKAHNPDPYQVDSDPYGLALGSDGMVYVAEAAGNDILRVNPNNGEVSLLAVIPGIAIPASLAPPGGNPDRGGKNELDPVPTGLAFGADGALYVSLLSGGPFPAGAAKVVRVTMDGKVSDAVPGLTMLTDIARGPDGNWYIAQFGEFDLTSNPPNFTPGSGQILRLRSSGQREVVAGGLNFPNKLTFDQNGSLYFTTNSLIPGQGQIMRIDNATTVTLPGMPRTGHAGEDLNLALALALSLLGAGVVLRRRRAGQAA